ncbi:hypothetical protein EXN22_04135 [Pseudomonas tructae]|uniref:Dermonecrotic toxin N-terminal domain-containing protein n=1 Tax=Pseudomonas tructae TaxID=2518644 RepID=A0A411MDN8_9PSED|nr:DUF6543 domain-containing protein [Pseudomonas tructae]QBF24921.1 hypothetical protein EXN22_04135 [Pseudomonas tructae]
MPSPRASTLVGRSDDFIQSAQASNDSQTLHWIIQQTQSALATLTPDLKKMYADLCLEAPDLKEALGQAMRQFIQRVDTHAISHLSLALENHLGRPVDLFSSKLLTQIETPSENTFSVHYQTVEMRLWDAARKNFGFHQGSRWSPGSSDRFHQNSSILEPDIPSGAKALTSQDFVDLVREVDLGGKFLTFFEQHFNNDIKPQLIAYQTASLKLALLEALRQGEINLAEYNHLNTNTTNPDTPWSTYSLTFGSERAALDLFIRQITHLPDTPTFSYLPGRPEGEIKRHGSIASALESARISLRTTSTNSHIPWFLRKLAVRDQLKLQRFLKTPQVDTTQLSWLSHQLFQLLGDDSPQGSRLDIQLSTSFDALSTAIYKNGALRFYSDALKDYQPVSDLDHDTWVKGASSIISEVVDLLLIPAPGGVTGLSTLMMTASLGALGYQTFVASVALSQGGRSEFVQAMADIFDLAISAALQGLGGKVSALRTRNLIKALRNPRLATDNAGTTTLAWTRSAPASTTTSNVDSLSDTQLLNKMRSPELPAMTDSQLQRLLVITDTTRKTLNAIWAGEQDAPWALREAMDAQQLRVRLDDLDTALDQHASPLPTLADKVLPPLLAIKADANIRIYDSDRKTLQAQYQPANPSVPDIVLVRNGNNRYNPFIADPRDTSLPLIAAVLQEHERLQPDGTLGKRGEFALDGHFQHRVDHLRSLLSAEFKRQRPALYQALLEDRPRSELDPQQPAYPFSRTAPPSNDSQATLNNLLQHFPDLTHSAAVQVVREYPQNTFDPSTVFPSEQLDRITEIRTQSRTRQALTSLEDANDRGMGHDTESVFAHWLSALPNWAESLGIKVFNGIRSDSGIRKGEKVLAQYGDESAQRFIELVKTDNSYTAYDLRSEAVVQPYPDQNSLVSAMLRALDNTQRNKLGYSIQDSKGLAKDLVDVISRHPRLWPGLLSHDTTYTLSSKRLAGFNSVVTIRANSINNDGVYRQDGKRYILHDGQAYQVLKDEGASTPQRAVWRIVRPADAVAQDESNRYVASRPGRSEAVIRNFDDQWVGLVVAGAGGMKRADAKTQAKILKAMMELASNGRQIVVLEDLITNLNAQVDSHTNPVLGPEIHSVLERLIGLNERKTNLLEQNLQLYKKHAPLLAKNITTRVDFFSDRATTLMLHASALYAQTTIEQVKLNERVSGLGDFDPLSNPLNIRRLSRENISTIKYKLPYAEKAEQSIAAFKEELANLKQYQHDEGAQAALEKQQEHLDDYETHKPPVSYYLRYAGIFFRLSLLYVSDTVDPSAPYFLQPIFQKIDPQIRLAVIALDEASKVPREHRLPLLEDTQLALEAQLEQLQNQSESLSLESDKSHLKEVIEQVQYYLGLADERIATLFDSISEADALNRGNEDIDFDFIPAQTGPVPPARSTRKVIRLNRPQGGVRVTAEVNPDAQDQVRVKQPDTGEIVQTYSKHNNQWTASSKTVPATSDYSAARQQASTLLQQSASALVQAKEMIRKKQLPINVYEFLERKAAQLQEQTDILKQDSQTDNGSLVTQLETKSVELLTQAKVLLISGYKDTNVLSVPRLRYLIDNDEVRVKREVERKRIGKGASKSFLDVYYIYDKGTDQKLWTAHFHYPKSDSRILDFGLKGGHLKRLDQDTQGQSQQTGQEQAGTTITPIWRETIDRTSAGELFRLAGTA